jgi:non-specific protein-tyrosine kinase
MAALLETLRDEYDVIILDTPPLLPVTDAAVVATNADGAVLVARWGKTSQARIKMALASLRAVDSRIFGCVLNMQPSKGEAGYYYAHTPETSTPHRSERKRSAAQQPVAETVPPVAPVQVSTELSAGSPLAGPAVDGLTAAKATSSR